jgi:ATP synthase protein I
VLALLLVLPVVGGAYLGHWLDSLSAGYSVRWTVGLIVAGVGVGAVNVYLYIREH